ncbi:MAG: PIG-L deacetylase family protein [Armatimonadota bacterium]
MRRTLKLTAAVLGLAAAAGVATALVIQYRIRVANDWQQYAPIRCARVPVRGDSIIVFAPHCDDETLGCGGMLAAAHANGARVRVVLVTNGDGFRIGAAQAYRTVRVTPAMCIDYALRRQKETLSALRALSIPSRAVTFLGYPDRGIAALWNDYYAFDRLYVSHATATDHSPYPNSYTLYAPYCGESLLDDIARIIRSERPTDIYLPHPSDNHSDHYATYCFVTAAVAQLESEGFLGSGQVRMHTYLVHRGDWPVPRGDHPDEPLAPPHALARGDTEWFSFPLGNDIAEAKRTAIMRYRSQTAIEKGFLTSFARRNELFGNLPVRRVASARDGTHRVDGRTDDWDGVPPAVVDAVGDYVVARMVRGGDVRTVYLCRDSRRLYIRVDCVGRLSKRISYTVNLRWLSKDNSNRRSSIRIRPSQRYVPASAAWACNNNVLELAVPYGRSEMDATLFIQVITRLGRVTVDNTGWHEIILRRPARPEPS